MEGKGVIDVTNLMSVLNAAQVEATAVMDQCKELYPEAVSKAMEHQQIIADLKARGLHNEAKHYQDKLNKEAEESLEKLKENGGKTNSDKQGI